MSLKHTNLYFLTIVFLFCSSLLHAQGNMLSIDSEVPNELTVCGVLDTFSLELYNPSPATHTDVLLTVDMPDGILYQTGSITGASEFDTSDLSQPVFQLPDIPTLTTVNVSYQGAASCDVMAFVSSGNLILNDVRVDYTSGTFQTYDEHETSIYFIRQPNISITSISNQTYSGSVGDVFTRCITIANGGLGSLSNFVLTETHGNGIQINNVDVGNWVNNGQDETITLSGVDFSQIGNNDTLFDSGEQIEICQTVEVVNCVDVASDYEAFWGCYGQVCQSSNSSANVVFPNLTPNLNVSHNPSMNSCLGPNSPSEQVITIENVGLGDAIDVELDIFQSRRTGFNAGLKSRIDENSITIQYGNGPVNSIAPTNTANNNNYACLQYPNPIGRVFLDIPQIDAGETVTIRWDVYSCCYTSCNSSNSVRDLNGWKYQGSYSNVCQENYIINTTNALNDRRLYGRLVNNGSPATLSAGQTETFSFVFSNYGNSYPSGPNRYWKFVVDLPPCVVYNGNMELRNRNGVSVWNPSSVNAAGSQLTAIFNGSPPWNLNQAQLNFDLGVDCNGCASGSSGNVSVESFYIPNGNCGCEVSVSCESSQLSVVCPQTCQGMTSTGFEMERTSYGLADNNEDGVPDANPNNLDFNLIRTDRVMFGDTVTSSFQGNINAGPNNDWEFLYASSTISNGNRISFLDAELKIFRGNQVFTCNNIAPTVNTAGTSRTFDYDLSASVLNNAGCFNPAFTYQPGDSVVFSPRYEVTSNPGGNVLECNAENDFYTSLIANPPDPADWYSCNDYRGNFSIVGYYFTNWGPNDYSTSACDDITISQNYYLSIGPCCQNYAGGNFFPYEYRYWAHIQNLRIEVPAGYVYQSARFNHRRTRGNGGYTHPWVNVNPINPNSTNLEFEVEQYYQDFGGTIQFSDDGFYGTIQVTLTPSCSVQPNVASNILYDWTFGESNYLLGSNSSNTVARGNHDYILYNAPDLLLQSTLPSVLAPNQLAEWEISISNTSNADALNTWLAAPSSAGITVQEIYDLDNNQVLTNNGGIYEVGTVNGASTRNFRIRADYTNCSTEIIELFTGWNCDAGYPADLASYPCNTESITLSLTPQSPTLIANVNSPSSSVDLCDTASYSVVGENIQLGSAYNLTLTVVLPVGVSIIPGSAAMEFPIGSGLTTIPDPVFNGGTTWEWDLSSYDQQLDSAGLKGLLSQSYNEIFVSFDVATGCDYISGSLIGFNFQGESACGETTGQEITLSSQLAITGASEPYFTEIDMNTTYISPCNLASEMEMSIVNTGPLDFGPTDTVSILLPEGVTYVPGSFGSVYNSPTQTNPDITILNNRQQIAWLLPVGTSINDSTVFTFEYEGDASALDCDIYDFEATTVSSNNIQCVSSGQPCDIRVVTGSADLPVYVYKASLLLPNASATAVPVNNSQEEVSFQIDIANAGQTILPGNESIINYYHDADASGGLSPGDPLIGADTITQQIGNNSTYTHSSSQVFNTGQTCPIIAEVNEQDNVCACSSVEILIDDIPLINAGQDTNMCSGDTINIGFDAVPTYTYTWDPAANLSDPNISDPEFTAINNTNSDQTFEYVLTTDRGLCNSVDTVVVTVHPLPVMGLTGLDPEYCLNGAASVLSGNPVGGNYAGNGLTGNTFNPAIADTGTHYITYTFTDANTCTNSIADTTIVQPLPQIAISSFGEVCLDSDPVNLNQGNPAGGSYFGDFVNNGAFDPTAAGLGFHTIYYTYTDPVYSCSDTSSNTILVNPLPEINLDSIVDVSCFGLSDAAVYISPDSGTAPYQYDWSNNTSNQNLTGVDTGTYYLILTDDKGCVDSALYTISQPDSLMASDSLSTYIGGNSVSCFGASDATVYVDIIGGTQPYTYEWTGNSNSIPLTNASAGTYGFTVIDNNGCRDTLQMTLTQPDSLSSSFVPTTYAGGYNISCYGNSDGRVATTASGGILPYDFAWSNSVFDSVNTGLEAGLYTVTITDTNNCSLIKSITLEEPDSISLNYSIDSIECLGGDNGSVSVGPQGGVSPYDYNWSTNDSTTTINNLMAGDYTITITDQNGCTFSQTITVSDGYQLEIFTDAAMVSCYGFADASAEVNTVNGLAPFDYNWSNTSQAKTNEPLDVGTYYVTVTDDNNCEAEDSIIITQPDSLSAEISGTNITCYQGSDGEAMLMVDGGTTPYDILWSDGTPGELVENLSAGTYQVTVTDSHDCQLEKSITLDQPDRMWVKTDSQTYEIPLGGEVEVTTAHFANNRGISAYVWEPAEGLECTDCASTIASPPQETLYNIEVTDDSGCKADTNFLVQIKEDKVFYAPTAFSPNDDGQNEEFRVYALGVERFNLQIFDRWGNKVFETNDINEGWDGTYKGMPAESEVYIYKVYADFLDKEAMRESGSLTLLR